MNFENIIKSIDDLAPLSNAIVEIQKLFNEGQEDLDISKLVELIESDAILSVNILKMANSPMYGFSSRIASVSQAVTLFGIMQIYGFIMSYAVSENIKAKTEIFGHTNERFNDICNMQSALIIQWYSTIDRHNARFLAPLALIMETGKLVVSNEVCASSYEKEFTEEFKKSTNIVEYEKELLGTSSYNLSSMVFKHWNLEPTYINILKELDEESHDNQQIKNYVDILNVVITAVNMKSILTKKSVLSACKIVQSMHLNPDTFAQMALKVKKSYVEELKSRDIN